MVLDVKALTWASQNGIDTAKLKAAKVPIYGKWYFPELPPDTALVRLDSGERQTFPVRMLAGEVLWVAEGDLRRAGMGPYAAGGERALDAQPPAAMVTQATAALAPVVPRIALSRPVPAAEAALQFGEHEALEREARRTGAEPDEDPLYGAQLAGAPDVLLGVDEEHVDLSSIHMPNASIAPFVLGIGISLALLGLITHLVILVVGLLWTLVGAIGWIRIGLLEARAGAAHGHGEQQHAGHA